MISRRSTSSSSRIRSRSGTSKSSSSSIRTVKVEVATKKKCGESNGAIYISRIQRISKKQMIKNKRGTHFVNFIIKLKTIVFDSTLYIGLSRKVLFYP